eukprot:3274901-Prorocentrum_lima.AAC.1
MTIGLPTTGEVLAASATSAKTCAGAAVAALEDETAPDRHPSYPRRPKSEELSPLQRRQRYPPKGLSGESSR